MNNKIRAAVAGGAGYTGGELIRLLLNHPNIEIAGITSQSRAGMAVASVHRTWPGTRNWYLKRHCPGQALTCCFSAWDTNGHANSFGKTTWKRLVTS